MATGIDQKRCKVCGKDVSQVKRTKDTSGNYYCDPCWETRLASQPAAARADGAVVGRSHQVSPADPAPARVQVRDKERLPVTTLETLRLSKRSRTILLSSLLAIIVAVPATLILNNGRVQRKIRSDATALRLRGDELTAQKQFDEAIATYGRVAEMLKAAGCSDEDADRRLAEWALSDAQNAKIKKQVDDQMLKEKADRLQAAELLARGRALADSGRNESDRQEGFALVQNASTLGSLDACALLGDLYALGIGTPVNDSEAFSSYTKAVDSLSKTQAFRLAQMYRDGRGTAADPKKALLIFIHCAEGGMTEAMHEVGTSFETGVGDSVNTEIARHWYQKAIDAKSMDARLRMGLMLYRTESPRVWGTSGARFHLRAAALAGRPEALSVFREEEPALIELRTKYLDSAQPCVEQVKVLLDAAKRNADRAELHTLWFRASEARQAVRDPNGCGGDELVFDSSLNDPLSTFRHHLDELDLAVRFAQQGTAKDSQRAEKYRAEAAQRLKQGIDKSVKIIQQYSKLRAALEEDRKLISE